MASGGDAEDWAEKGGGMVAQWGFVGDDELARVVVVSPHLDDAVLSCGRFLAAHPGTTVVTVFAGVPATYPDPPAWWDRLCGFGPGDDVVRARRAEDEAALGLLGAIPRHLDLLEEHFRPAGPAVTADEVAALLRAELVALAPTMVLVPFGLANPEHVLVHEACLIVREAWGDGDGPVAPTWIAYEDFAYQQIPGQLAWRVASLFRSGRWPTPVAMPVDPSGTAKRAAVSAYASQVQGLDADWRLWPRLDAPTPEQYWRIEPPPPGWELLIDLV